MHQPRVIFAGTPEFALASLSALVDAGIEPVAVLTQPDRPAGRGKHLTASPVKQFALEAHDTPEPKGCACGGVVGPAPPRSDRTRYPV